MFGFIFKIGIFIGLIPRAHPKTPHQLFDDEEASVLTSDFDAKRWEDIWTSWAFINDVMHEGIWF